MTQSKQTPARSSAHPRPAEQRVSAATEARDGSLVGPDLNLRDVLAAVQRHGADRVRAGLRETPEGTGPVRVALDLWAGGGLTVPVFWNLARRARSRHEGGPMLPAPIDSRATRLTFLRCCEALLQAERDPLLLSLPTYQDGTLDFDDLLARLRAGGPVVGPLDLVQALYRLRPTDPGRASELRLPVVPIVAQLCRPEGQDGWNAVDLVRAWVAAGGLPSLEPRLSADGQSWTFQADAPVPWSLCSAAPTGMLDDDIARDGEPDEVARVFPLWPDLLVHPPFLTLSRPQPSFLTGLARLSGRFGVPSHDYLLAAMAQKNDERRKQSVDVIVDLVRRDRLDPHLAAEAALGRSAAGSLALTTALQSWEEIFRRGGLPGMWPVALEIAAALCGTSPKPPGLPALLRLLTAFAAEVPAPVAPDEIRRLAESRGATRSQVEARALVQAIATGK